MSVVVDFTGPVSSYVSIDVDYADTSVSVVVDYADTRFRKYLGKNEKVCEPFSPVHMDIWGPGRIF